MILNQILTKLNKPAQVQDKKWSFLIVSESFKTTQ